MPEIVLHTVIDAPAERCFQLALSIDLHEACAAHTHEKAVGGITSGLIKGGETVTWRAKHFGMYFSLTSKISEYNFPIMFVDDMLEGPFKKIHHRHSFYEENGKTTMKDEFFFKAPMFFLGTLAEKLFLEKYMRNFLIERNRFLKEVAESKDHWQKYLPNKNIG